MISRRRTGQRETRRPLPRSLDPLPDEALPGFVLRLAHRLDRTPARIAELTGLTEPHQVKPNLGRRIYLDPAAQARFAAATRLHPDEVADLCVAALADRYAPLSAQFLGRTRQPESVANDPWVFGRAIRYCPPCLAGDGSTVQNLHGGAWQRRWHLPVIFACLTHRRLLARDCPSCQRPAHHEANQPVPTPTVPGLHPAQCRNRISGRFRTPNLCGNRLDREPDPHAADLTVADLESRQVLRAQQNISTLLDPSEPGTSSAFGESATVAQFFTDLRLLASLTTLTWPVAAPLLTDRLLRDALDRHATRRHQVVADMRVTGKHLQRHVIFDQPPTDSLASAALMLLLHRLSASPSATEILASLLDHPDVTVWTSHFFTAEPHCSPGLRAAIAVPVSAHRRGARRAAAPPLRARKARTPRQPRLHRPAVKPPTPVTTVNPTRPLAPYRFGPQHIPAFLTDTWAAVHLHLAGVDQRMLRRAAACTLVSRSGYLSYGRAAVQLGLPSDAGDYAMRIVNRWRAADPVNRRRFDTALQALTDLLETCELIDYRQRRRVMATWTINTDLWHTISAELQRTQRGAQVPHSDWSDRKRITATALAWIEVTQGEHRYAPQRHHSPGAIPGTTTDRGLSIDRAWWRLRNGKPGQHYWELRAALIPHLTELATAIDDHRISAN
ncbi:TniQ family protein [Virgisporangium aurantiacum]|uniref:TniQ domain-containing protein n=1 Tax=Virgisporangium aurantiacum TaxID=175570 RepID=A0A8J3ZP38_9ACTN|nr:TniQ family protein [Virgisporangium aurantiacum]GIJ64985.1 hypothetical protein Vau01_125010 [Virgisporangium aurantiacum]